MSNIPISNLPAATLVTGAEQIPAVQSGTTVRMTTAQIATYAANVIVAPGISIGNNIGGSVAGYGLYANGSYQLGQFPYGTGVFAAIQLNVGSAGAPVLFNGAGGTPTSLTLTNATGTPASLGLANATGLPIAGISATGSPSSGNFLRGDGAWAAPVLTVGTTTISGATSGYLLYNNGGTLGSVAPTAASLSIGSPISGSAQVGYGLYVNSSTQLGQFAYGTGVFTALGVNVGLAGAPVLFNGAGGKPSSIDLTNAASLTLPVGSISATGTAGITTYLRGDGAWASVSGGSGTVTSVAQTFTGGIIAVGGSPVTTSGTLALTVSGTQGGIPYFSSSTAWTSSAALALNSLVIGGGTGAPTTTTTGTGVLTALGNTTNAASGIAVKDANANLSSNNLFETLTVITAAGTVTTLTASSAYSFVVNGSGGQTIQLPDATTLPVGAVYRFNNNQSSGTVTVRNNSSTTVVTLQSGSAVETTLLVNSPAAGTWDTHTLAPTNASWSTNTLTWTGTIGSGGAGSTWNAVPITIPYGGTGQTALATGDLIVGSGTNTSTRLTIGSTGQILTVSGGTATWQNAASGGVSTITFGSTGLTPNTATSGAVTVAGTLGAGYGGTGLATLTANAVILGNGTSAVQFVAPSTTGNVLTSNGTTWTSAAATGGAIKVYTNSTAGSASWVKATEAPGFAANSRVYVQIWGGGGSGGKGTSGYNATGGGGGGYNEAWFTLSDLSATVSVTIAAGGTSITALGTNGNPGGTSSFGAYISAYGGGGGQYGFNISNAFLGGGGGSQLSAGAIGGTPGDPSGVIGGGGCQPYYPPGFGGGISLQSKGVAGYNQGGGGGGSSNGSLASYDVGGASVWGGGGGGSSYNAKAGGVSSFGGAGGAGNATASTNAVTGSTPGGGGGGQAGVSGGSGAGGPGKIIVTVFPA